MKANEETCKSYSCDCIACDKPEFYDLQIDIAALDSENITGAVADFQGNAFAYSKLELSYGGMLLIKKDCLEGAGYV